MSLGEYHYSLDRERLAIPPLLRLDNYMEVWSERNWESELNVAVKQWSRQAIKPLRVGRFLAY